jgi:hypothetical protein
MVVLFDTSAINELHDDLCREQLVARLLSGGNVFVSALNVIEAGGTLDVARRRSLLQLLNQLTRGMRPLEIPPALARRAVEAYCRRAESLNWSVEEEGDAYWQVLQDPSLFDEEMRTTLNGRRFVLEEEFNALHARARPNFQALFTVGPPPRRPSGLLRAYSESDQFLLDAVRPLYEPIRGTSLEAAEARELLRTVPEVAGFLLGWGHSVHQRAIAQGGYGIRNAGNVDLWFATYLPRVTHFVTHDRRQYRALRLVGRIAAPSCQVLRYEPFRARLLVGL